MGFVIQTRFCISVFTNKSYCVTTIYSLSILQNSFFKAHENFNPDKLCVTTSYIQDDIMIVFTMAFKCVLKILKTCVNFTALQVENYFCSRKMFTSRKLTGVETSLPVSNFFSIK